MKTQNESINTTATVGYFSGKSPPPMVMRWLDRLLSTEYSLNGPVGNEFRGLRARTEFYRLQTDDGEIYGVKVNVWYRRVHRLDSASYPIRHEAFKVVHWSPVDVWIDVNRRLGSFIETILRSDPEFYIEFGDVFRERYEKRFDHAVESVWKCDVVEEIEDVIYPSKLLKRTKNTSRT